MNIATCVLSICRLSRAKNEVGIIGCTADDMETSVYGAQNEAYKGEMGRKAPKAVYLQRVARVEAVRSAQNETFT